MFLFSSFIFIDVVKLKILSIETKKKKPKQFFKSIIYKDEEANHKKTETKKKSKQFF